MGHKPSVTKDINLLITELSHLRQENQMLRRQKQDLELALLTTTEHGDCIEAELHEANIQLKAEVLERIKAEATLQALVQIISTQKADLEIIVQTIMEHGDIVDNQWYEKFMAATRLADLDGLTQIPNRRCFDSYFAEQWQASLENRTSLALMLCDIDHFKDYNDAYGHLAGDDCLKTIAQTLQRSVRRSSDLVARYGGEEFVILLPATDLKGAMYVAETAQAAIAQLQIPHQQSQVAPHVTLSIGLASLIPTPSLSEQHLLTLADEHLYLAKQGGKNQTVADLERAPTP
jgi:diguanylate cyclase (GGDEF)-like protein